jgi:hypothetical protein
MLRIRQVDAEFTQKSAGAEKIEVDINIIYRFYQNVVRVLLVGEVEARRNLKCAIRQTRNCV